MEFIDLSDWIGRIDPLWMYVVVTAFALLETAALLGFVVPGETTVIFAGVLAREGKLSLTTLLLIVPAAAFTGDTIGFLAGRWWGPPLLASRFGRRALAPEHVAYASRFLARHGLWAIAIGRWVGILRVALPLLAGTARIPYPRFAAASALGATTWATGCIVGGYLAATSWHLVEDWLSRGAYVVVALAALVVAGVVYRRRKRRRPKRADGGQATGPQVDAEP